MSKNFKSPPNCLGSIFKSILFVSLFCLPLFIIFFLTKNRVIDLPSNQILPAQKAKLVDTDPPISFVANHPKSEQDFNQPENRKPVETNPPNDVWCEVRDYKDLSQDLVFNEFNEWMGLYKNSVCKDKGNCQNQDHDPRKFAQLLQIGKSIAQRRGKTLSKIIRGDPKKAFDLALSREELANLPPLVSQEMEKWEVDTISLSAKHVCYDLNHPRGIIQREARLRGGKTYRAWTYGNYRKLPTIANMPIIGISLGEDLAISEDPYLVVEKAENLGVIEIAGLNYSYSNLEEKETAIRNSKRRVGELARIDLPRIKGKRKILFMTARFLDETTHYETLYERTGSHELITNELGEAVLREIQVDPYEPLAPEILQQAIAEVKDFYLRNTDGEFEIVPVVIPTMTMTIPRYKPTLGPEGQDSDPNPYDSSGRIAPDEKEIVYKELGLYPLSYASPLDSELNDEGLMGHAIRTATFLNSDWDPEGAAFIGISKIGLNNGVTKIDTNFTAPPTVTLVGGADPTAFSKFTPAKAEVVLDEDGDVISVQVVDPGAFYSITPNPNPKIFLNGVDYTSEFNISIDSMLVSIVLLTNFDKGSPGLGSVGTEWINPTDPKSWYPYYPVSHVQITDGSISSTTMAHEIGHNLGLWHAERYLSRSEKAISEDGEQIEYGNPYSIMGDAPSLVTGGDFTVPGKVSLYQRHPYLAPWFTPLSQRADDPIGYKLDVNAGADVADLNISILTKQNGGHFAESNELNHTYRIYRSNYKSPPLPLKEANFTVSFPEAVSTELNASLSPYDIQIFGSGEDANGSLHHLNGFSWNLAIASGGRGYVEEPLVKVFDYNESNVTPVLSIDPTWIHTPNGRDNNITASLLDYNRSNRWIRGIRVACSDEARKPLNVIDKGKTPPLGLFDRPLLDYYLSFRSDVSSHGLALLLATKMGTLENLDRITDAFMLDATPNTPQDFDDAALMIGSTYSDYDADVHFTPVRKGGKEPMPYIEVVINIGSVARGEARAPNFELQVSSLNPVVGDEITLYAKPLEANKTYAYSWYVNEQALDELKYLNRSSISLEIATAKSQVIRVLVSDMKGGVSSRNVVIRAQGDEVTNQSIITGSVRSGSGMVQGARAILAKAPVIEHDVSLVGDLFYNYFPDGENEPARYLIDGEIAPELFVRRGEIHRFYFDKSLDGHPFSFLEFQENAPPRFKINMLAEPQVDAKRGSGYKKNPSVSYTLRSAFSSYYSNHTGIYTDLNSTFDLPPQNLITRPHIKTLMQETNVSTGKVGPLEINELGYFTFGGKGYHRSNIPKVDVNRTSIWENYNNQNATAVAYVDGIGTISPVNAEQDEFLSNEWIGRPGDTIIPEIKFLGILDTDIDLPEEEEANASIIGFTEGGKTKRQINLTNQGKGYEPNSTMAVLHYPIKPEIYWTFDRHESLFEDSNQARHQPSPAWNREVDKINLRHHWKMDSNESATTLANSSLSAVLTQNSSITGDQFEWALKGKGISLSGEKLTATNPFDNNFTFSIWVKPEGNFSIDFGDFNVSYDTSADPQYSFKGVPSLNPKIDNYWTHVGVVRNESNVTLFVDGRKSSPQTISYSDANLTITTGNLAVVFDECKIYHAALSQSQVRYLAGRTILDLSGNKFNGVIMGSNSILESPNSNISSSDVPILVSTANSPNGSNRLGDSFLNELNGHSIKLNGVDQYLDISTFAPNFNFEQGTISLWIKSAALQANAPILSVANPYLAITSGEANSTFQISEPGTIFSLELLNGKPKIAGYLGSQQLTVGKWVHLVATFGANLPKIWIDGMSQNVSFVGSQSEDRFTESDTLSVFSAGADLFSIGRSYSRTDNPLTERPSEIFFNGMVDDFAMYSRELEDSEVKYLYNLASGREQIPRLETLVDAVGTVEIIQGGEGYRENPDLIFWYGQTAMDASALNNFPSVTAMEGNYTDANNEYNGTEGEFVYVAGAVDEAEEGVYTYHTGKDKNRSYNWRKAGGNGWRKHIPAVGYAEYEDASVGELIWTHRLPSPIELVLPDGRTILRKDIDYITTNSSRSLPLEMNNSLSFWGSLNNRYFQTSGLFGFSEKASLMFEPNATSGAEAEAFIFYWIDDEDNDSVTIIDTGHGVEDMNNTLFRVSGKGYQPPSRSGPVQEAESPKPTNITIGDEVNGSIYSVYDWNGTHNVNVSNMEFNQTYSSISVDNSGFGYSMPVELKVFGGLPQPNIDKTELQSPGSLLPYDANITRAKAFTPAILEVNETNETGAIIDVFIRDPGRGYIAYHNYVDLAGDSGGNLSASNLDPWLNDQNYSYTNFPIITVSGGGGNGALLKPILDENGSVVDVNITSGGRGYFNINPNNKPNAVHTPTLSSSERNASLSVRLGGYLKEIPTCSGCNDGTHQPPHLNQQEYYSHLEPWIEIWDRGRPEGEIDLLQIRAHATPRVVDGKIMDVIVTQSGYGYIDPVAFVRDAPPKHYKYFDEISFSMDANDTNGTTDFYRRKWRCTYLRTTEDGKKKECGHVHWALYPPEECPGETDNEFPYLDGNGSLVPSDGESVGAWQKRHSPSRRDHLYCIKDGNNTEHLDVKFLARKCWGTKLNFVLYNDNYYRNGAGWIDLDANLSVITEGGRIREIVVDHEGYNYYASQIAVVGSGSGVEAIPVFNEYGNNTKVIFYDERQKNLEFDIIPRPDGAGQGFIERPWSWDSQNNAYYKETVSDTPYYSWENIPLTGFYEAAITHTRHSQPDYSKEDNDSIEVAIIREGWEKSGGDWSYGQPILADALGDRIVEVQVRDPGLYSSTPGAVTIEFNASHVPDQDRNGQADFIAASLSPVITHHLTYVQLDGNASYDDNGSDVNMTRGLFEETPIVRLLYDAETSVRGEITYDQDDILTDYIRLRNRSLYDPLRESSYIDLYIDDRFPNQLFYGYGHGSGSNPQNFPAMGGKIIVSESLPGLNWAINEPLYKPHYSYTDQSGQFAFAELEPGMYNLAVLMEDQGYQESTFRPEGNKTRVSQVVYVPGFPELTLETDNGGWGKSRLVWSRESRLLSRPFEESTDNNYSEEYESEYILKVLEGIGRGFINPLNPRLDPITFPDLIFIPHPDNISKITPNIIMGWDTEHDGSIALKIVDDENTSRYYPGDKFTVRLSTVIEGQDFFESYLYTESNQSFDSGVLASWGYDASEANRSRYVSGPRLLIFPDDSEGTNPIELPLSANSIDHELLLTAFVVDANGSYQNVPIDWQIHLDFNASDKNNSRVAQLEDPSGTRDANISNEEQVGLYLYSTLRESVGSVHDFEIVDGGENYQLGDRIRLSGGGYGFEANITGISSDPLDPPGKISDINVSARGFNIPKDTTVSIWDDTLNNLSSGIGAVIKPVFPSGYLEVEANATYMVNGVPIPLSKKVRVKPSTRTILNNQEAWLDKYTDSFYFKDNAQRLIWLDLDSDGNNPTEDSNLQEWERGTNPLIADTDGDGLEDLNEINGILGINLVRYFPNPLNFDTDGDGWNDKEENDNSTNPNSKDTDKDGLIDSVDANPTSSTGNGLFSGLIILSEKYMNLEHTIYFQDLPGGSNYQPVTPTTDWKKLGRDPVYNFYETGKEAADFTLRAFIDFEWLPGNDGTYTQGEPFFEHNFTLAEGEKKYGINLIPVDDPPVLSFKNPIDDNITLNISESTISEQFDWKVEAYDPLYGFIGPDSNNTNIYGPVQNSYVEYASVYGNQKISFLVEGNFTQFLVDNNNASNGLATFDLVNIPVGTWGLTYQAIDEHNNTSNVLEQNITIIDGQEPFITILDFDNYLIASNLDVTDLSKSNIIGANSLASFDVNETNTSIVWKWEAGKEFAFSNWNSPADTNIRVHVMDTKDELIYDWNVSFHYSPLEYNETADQNLSNFDLKFTAHSDFKAVIVNQDDTGAYRLANYTEDSGTFRIRLRAKDRAGNPTTFNLYLEIDAAYSAEITAVDGYLENALVIFDSNNDGISDLDRQIYTDSNGKAKIILTKEEFRKFDANSNGKLDPNEGKFIVKGGIDTSTGTQFSGKLIADANATVISPLTTMVSKLMDLGATKEEAIAALALALDLDSTIDFTTYDPIQKAFEGHGDATNVMMANLRMANLINQAEGLLLTLSSDYQGYEIGSSLLGEIAKGLKETNFSGFDLQNTLLDALPMALASIGVEGELTLEDQLAMFQLMADLDKSILAYDEDMDFVSLMEQQRGIIEELETLFDELEDGNRNLTLRTHQLLVASQAGGTAGESGSFAYGSKVAIHASPLEGFLFTGWEGEGLTDANASSTFVTMFGDRNLTARFTPQKYEIVLAAFAGGEVSGEGNYSHGESVELLATPSLGWEFLEWRNKGAKFASSPNIAITADKSLALNAHFTQIIPELELTAGGDGTILTSGGYEYGEVVYLQALPKDGYIFDHWIGEGIEDIYSQFTSVLMVEDRRLQATFLPQPAETFSLTLASSPLVAGQFVGAGVYPEGTAVNIFAKPLPGYAFENWIGDEIAQATEANTTIVLTANTHLEAQFATINYLLDINSSKGGVVVGAGTYPFGTLINLSAIPHPGYQFVQWLGNGILNPYIAEIKFEVLGNASLGAVFQPQKYSLEINGTSGGLAYGEGEYGYGTTVKIVAEPSTGYRFDGWEGDDILEPESLATWVTITRDTKIGANFVRNENFFTPKAKNFSIWIDRSDYQPGDILHRVLGEDRDGDPITYVLSSENIDYDQDGTPMLIFSENGILSISDPDEINSLSGVSLNLRISLRDTAGKNSESLGLVRIANQYVLNSSNLGNGWYESPWLGVFLQMENSWLYHEHLGWLFAHSLNSGGYWFWDAKREDWFWTEKTFFPWVFSNADLVWIYFNLESEKVRFFNHNLQEWNYRP